MSSGTNHVGDHPHIDEANEQRLNPSEADGKGQKNAHKPDDPKDSRTNMKDIAQQAELVEEIKEHEAKENTVTDPLEPARVHGNKPSRGAEIDAELLAADKKELEKKELKKPQ